MIDKNRKRLLGDTVAGYIDTLPYELDGDGVGFWVIVPAGRSFGFEGQDLAEFVRLCIERLIDVGGIVARFADHGPRGSSKWGTGARSRRLLPQLLPNGRCKVAAIPTGKACGS